jgi:hypothetical protein
LGRIPIGEARLHLRSLAVDAASRTIVSLIRSQ